MPVKGKMDFGKMAVLIQDKLKGAWKEIEYSNDADFFTEPERPINIEINVNVKISL